MDEPSKTALIHQFQNVLSCLEVAERDVLESFSALKTRNSLSPPEDSSIDSSPISRWRRKVLLHVLFNNEKIDWTQSQRGLPILILRKRFVVSSHSCFSALSEGPLRVRYKFVRLFHALSTWALVTWIWVCMWVQNVSICCSCSSSCSCSNKQRPGDNNWPGWTWKSRHIFCGHVAAALCVLDIRTHTYHHSSFLAWSHRGSPWKSTLPICLATSSSKQIDWNMKELSGSYLSGKVSLLASNMVKSFHRAKYTWKNSRSRNRLQPLFFLPLFYASSTKHVCVQRPSRPWPDGWHRIYRGTSSFLNPPRVKL